MSEIVSEPDVVTVEYEIVGSSEHSGAYSAENILVDRPRDQGSRWSGVMVPASTKQWIRLRLKRTSVLKSITFGKYYKPHPCNMKDFKVLVGMTEASMTEVLQGSIKNDSTTETFLIKSTNRAGMPFPTRFVEIVPLTAHGQSFNTSIWHVSLSGIDDENYVEHIRQRHQEYRENSTLRQILKHLRQRRFLTPVAQVLARSGLQLEHPIITSLHEAFVLNGNWAESENRIQECANEGLFGNYRHSCQAYMRWSRIRGMDLDGDIPRRRGGHAMCIDEQNGMIYLFGGWDGHASLDDFWVYDIAEDAWRLLSLATSRDKNGPGPRACHKMVFDHKTGCIYLLGRLGEGGGEEAHRARSLPVPELREASASRDSPHLWPGPPVVPTTSPTEMQAGPASMFTQAWPSHCSEFYRYHTRGLDAGKWDLLSFDTASSGGPPLIYDHQMAIDSETQMIYVSGGRVVEPEYDVLKFSGMYSYDIRTSRWKMYNTSDSYAAHPYIPPRFGHSMVFDPKFQSLFIFAGQRDERYFSDMYAFHIPTSTVTELFSNFTAAGGPDPCFTQRAVIDPERREIYVVCGLTRTKSSITPTLDAEPYWIYRYNRPELPGKWSKILPSSDSEEVGPLARYAHQVVYNSKSGALYMHGGNAGLGTDDDESSEGDARPSSSGSGAERKGPGGRVSSDSDTEKRLDDFWRLEIVRPSNEEIVRRALYEIRQQQFREMCEDSPPIKALTFLQTRVSAVVKHEDPDEAKAFRSLLSAHLLAAPTRPTPSLGLAAPTHTGVGDNGRADSPPPRKRSRPSSPSPGTGMSSTRLLRYDEDPIEAGGNPPSPERYRQRTQMFERLLAFVNDEAKQPDQSLMDMLSGDGLGV